MISLITTPAPRAELASDKASAINAPPGATRICVIIFALLTISNCAAAPAVNAAPCKPGKPVASTKPRQRDFIPLRDMSTKCLVTGAAGFIGSHLVDALLARGATILGLDNLKL